MTPELADTQNSYRGGDWAGFKFGVQWADYYEPDSEATGTGTASLTENLNRGEQGLLRRVEWAGFGNAAGA